MTGKLQEGRFGARLRLAVILIIALAILLIPECESVAGEIGVDHSAWASFLETYVVETEDGINRVRYADVTPGDRLALSDYLAALARIDLAALDREEQMAFWINLYNALTVNVVLDHYPVDSILDIDISPGLFSQGPWGRPLFSLGDRQLGLDDIEHGILRIEWHDPRVHYALSCASTGCPNLSRQPYLGATLDEQLGSAAVQYINHSRAVRIVNGELYVSSIYDWYEEDFGDGEEEIIRHLISYAKPDLAAVLSGFEAIAEDFYDWSLNDMDVPGDGPNS